SGVNNRNHCPYCLHSRHMDLYEPGDRLSACKAEMRPVGLTLKRTRKKYGRQQGELMLIHQCADCGSISANRLAADDDADTILAIYESSLHLDPQTTAQITRSGVEALQAVDHELVCTRLFGRDRCQERVMVYA
ncbi:MAG: RNHCP domain-containing protein, partial [Chloroflexi bacterium]